MKKYLFLPVFIFIMVSSGCGITKIQPTTSVREESKQTQESTTTIQKPKEKIISWCDKRDMEYQKETFHEGKLWISSEYFSGMNHAPAVRHFCREDKEIFALEMEWNNNASVHKGKLISNGSDATLSINSKNKDPEVQLVEEQNKKNESQLWFTLDGKIFLFDQDENKFVENPKM